MPVPTVKTRFSSRNKANEESLTTEESLRPAVPVMSSSSLPRPSLLGAGAHLPPLSSPDSDSLFPPRPRRLWRVSDTRLNALPAGYPPIDPRCSVYVADAPPSVVAVRIAEALRRLSVAVEYDEETPCATCWTADRCHFVVQLWQGPKSYGSVRLPHNRTIPDLSAGILVEGMRLCGSVITYHRMIRSILAAAQSHDTGDDRRQWYQTNSLEFPRWTEPSPAVLVDNGSTTIESSAATLATTLEALEEVAALLEKDRHDAQSLGMERLVQLTDVHTVGVDVATVAAQSLLGIPPGVEDPSSLLINLHVDWMMGLLMQRRLPNEKDELPEDMDDPTPSTATMPMATAPPPSRLNRFTCSPKQGQTDHHAAGQAGMEAAAVGAETTTTTTALDKNDEDNESARVEALLQQMRQERALLTGDANHAGRLRGLLMRVWANCLQVLHQHEHVILTSLLQHQKDMNSQEFLEVLMEDVNGGCSRPPLAAVMGTRLASPHEAVWALVSLRVLAQHSSVVRKHLEKSTYQGVLEKALMVGSACHDILRQEASLALAAWKDKRYLSTSL